MGRHSHPPSGATRLSLFSRMEPQLKPERPRNGSCPSLPMPVEGPPLASEKYGRRFYVSSAWRPRLGGPLWKTSRLKTGRAQKGGASSHAFVGSNWAPGPSSCWPPAGAGARRAAPGRLKRERAGQRHVMFSTLVYFFGGVVGGAWVVGDGSRWLGAWGAGWGVWEWLGEFRGRGGG